MRAEVGGNVLAQCLGVICPGVIGTHPQRGLGGARTARCVEPDEGYVPGTLSEYSTIFPPFPFDDTNTESWTRATRRSPRLGGVR